MSDFPLPCKSCFTNPKLVACQRGLPVSQWRKPFGHKASLQNLAAGVVDSPELFGTSKNIYRLAAATPIVCAAGLCVRRRYHKFNHVRNSFCTRACGGSEENATSFVCTAGAGAEGTRYYWDWRPSVRIHFERAVPATSVPSDRFPSETDSKYAVVMVHGFGAEGSYFTSQLRAISQAGGAAYAVDLFGQGQSWPLKNPTGGNNDAEWGWGESLVEDFTDGLAFGEPTWIEQLTDFIRKVVPEKRVYLLGNSVGGYVVAKAAAGKLHGDPKIRGLVLANPTPFWGWTQEGFTPWDGTLPVPGWVRPLATVWYRGLQANIDAMLQTVYAIPENDVVEARVGNLARRIGEAASHPMGPAAFASILFAPKQEPSFGDALDRLALKELPVLLIYGDDDPWIVPFWARRAANRLDAGNCGEYYAISPAGHCPHHEAPAAFNQILVSWISRFESKSLSAVLLERGSSMEGLLFIEEDVPIEAVVDGEERKQRELSVLEAISKTVQIAVNGATQEGSNARRSREGLAMIERRL